MRPRPTPAPKRTDGRADVDFDDACTLCGAPLEGTFCASCSLERAELEVFGPLDDEPDTERQPGGPLWFEARPSSSDVAYPENRDHSNEGGR